MFKKSAKPAFEQGIVGVVVFSGVANKRSRGICTSNLHWQRRFIIVTPAEICYFDKFFDPQTRNHDSGATKKGSIPVARLTGVERVQRSKEKGMIDKDHVFKITHNADAKGELYIQVIVDSAANSDIDPRDEWIQAIENVLPGGCRRGSSFSVTPTRKPTMVTAFRDEDWFVGTQSSQDTAKQLIKLPVGAFFVRESTTREDAYTLDVRTDNPDEPVVSRRIIFEHMQFRFEDETKYYSTLFGCALKSGAKLRVPEKRRNSIDSMSSGYSSPGSGRRPSTAGSAAGPGTQYRDVTGQRESPLAGRRPSASSIASGSPHNARRPSVTSNASGVSATKANPVGLYETMSTPVEQPYPLATHSEEPTEESEAERKQKVNSLTSADVNALLYENVGDLLGAQEGAQDIPAYYVRPASKYDYEADAIYAGVSLPAAAADPAEPTESFPKRVMYKTTVSPDVLATLSKIEIDRQEAIFEFIDTDEKFLLKLSCFVSHVLPELEVCGVSIGWDRQLIPKVLAVCTRLHEACSQFLDKLKARQSEQVVVETIADILMEPEHSDDLGKIYYEYHELFPDLEKSLSDAPSPILVAIMDRINQSPKMMGLPVNSFCLEPPQRLMRYAMLVEAIHDKTTDPRDREMLYDVMIQWRKRTQTINAGMGKVKDMFDLRKCHSMMDYSNLSGHEHIWNSKLEVGDRTIVRTDSLGVVTLTKVGQKLKITKRSKPVTVMLLNDLFVVYRDKKANGTIRKEVYKIAARSLVYCAQVLEATEDPTLQEKLIRIEVLSGDPRDKEVGKNSETFHFVTASSTDRDRWVDLFNPAPMEGCDYAEHDCPEYRVIKDWIPPAGQTDSMPLRVGVVVAVQKKGKEWMKGFMKQAPPFPSFRTDGYFPADCVKEIPSDRAHHKELRHMHEQQERARTGSDAM